jgi:hypothetical protein
MIALNHLCAPEVKTTCQLLNVDYRQRTVSILRGDEGFRWVYDMEQMKAIAAKKRQATSTGGPKPQLQKIFLKLTRAKHATSPPR